MKVSFEHLGLEFMEATESGNPVAERVEKYGQGVAWIALKVPNLDEAVAELKGKGIAVEFWGIVASQLIRETLGRQER